MSNGLVAAVDREMADEVVTLSTGLELSSLASNISSSSTSSSSFSLRHIIWVYVLPAFILVGVIGNILSVIVLLSKAFRNTTTGVYLPLTAVADVIFLLTGRHRQRTCTVTFIPISK